MRVVSISVRGARGICSPPTLVPVIGGAVSFRPFSTPSSPAAITAANGGKGANIVFEDADLDNAVHWAVEAIFRNAGQVCLAGSRLYVQRGIYEDFMARYKVAAEALVMGDPKDPATQFSAALASEEHFTKVQGYLGADALGGGRVLTGGVGDGWSV